MNSPGETRDLFVRARSALLDALDALSDHKDSVIVIGAQAVYLRTAGALVAIAEATKDSDLALDPRTLNDDPRIETAMLDAGFVRDPEKNQPGAWLNSDEIPVDLMVPELLAGGGDKSARGARIPPHGKHATRRARGLEAALVDNDILLVPSLDSADDREHQVRVAGTAALIIAKAHKIAERVEDSPGRLVDKDAHDLYRVLTATATASLATTFNLLRDHEIAGETTSEAIEFLDKLFAAGPDAIGSVMAGRTEEGVGEPETVALQTSILAADLLEHSKDPDLSPGLPDQTSSNASPSSLGWSITPRWRRGSGRTAASRRRCQATLAHRREADRSAYVVVTQLRKVDNDLSAGHARCEIVQNVVDRDSRSDEARLATAHARPSLDQRHQIHSATLPLPSPADLSTAGGPAGDCRVVRR